MAIDIIDAAEIDREVILRHIVESRSPNWSETQLGDYVNWRYFGRQKSVPVLAMSGNECLAFIDSQLRHYSLRGETLALQESSEWYCKPKYRPTGLGVRVLQKLMARDEPIISIRGTEASQQLVLKMGWINLAPVYLFSKMVNWKTKTTDFIRKLRGTGSEEIDLVMQVDPPSEARVPINVPHAGGLKGFIEPWEIGWFSNCPQVVGKFHWLSFQLNHESVGYSLVRIYEGSEYRRAQIVHFDTSSSAPNVIEQMLRLTTRFLANEGALRILGRASGGSMGEAFEQNGYLNSGPQPVFLWSQEKIDFSADNENYLTYLRGDDAIRPFSIMHNSGAI